MLLALFRLVFVGIFVPFTLISKNLHSLSLLIFNALRFDLQVTAYTLLLPTLLSIIILAGGVGIPVCGKLGRASISACVNKCIRWYFVFVYVLLFLLCMIDLGFYSNFNSHINITFFDFFNEGPLSLLQTIWQEYHCVLYFYIIVLITIMIVWLTKRIENSNNQPYQKWHWVLMVAYIIVLFVCLRGSVWRFPLQIEDTFVSVDKTINDIVPNAPYMLKKALKEKKNSFQIKSVASLLKEYQFASVRQALNVYTQGKVVLQNNDTLQALQKALFVDVPKTWHILQPNIVIIYSESWSNYLFELHSKNCDMYLGLQRHFKEDLLFRHFLSVQNGTIASIENLIVGTPYPRFFASKYRLKLLPTSIAIPFNQSGYDTEFLSGMDMAWENSAEALTHQQFKKVRDKFSILKDNPCAQYNSIGVYDEFLFQYLLKQLSEKTQRPQMIAVMTTTNHPPFEFPKHLHLPVLGSKVYQNKCFAEKNQKVLNKYLTGFRYYNKVLAKFLTQFKQSLAAKNTILVVTGDHNVRSILNYDVVEKRWERSVPLYIYLPPALRQPQYHQLTQRFGCHDDIIPTLAPFAFSNTRYFCMGHNLLDVSAPNSLYYGYNVLQLLAPWGMYHKASCRIAARNMLRELYLQHFLSHY